MKREEREIRDRWELAERTAFRRSIEDGKGYPPRVLRAGLYDSAFEDITWLLEEVQDLRRELAGKGQAK